MIACIACGVALEYSGKGRRPKRCAPDQRRHNLLRAGQRSARVRKHKTGRAVTRFGPYWANGERIVRRDSAQVWGGFSDLDGQVISAAGVFAPIGERGIKGDGLPDYGRIEPELAARWFEENPTWWRMYEFAHGAFSRDQADEVVANARMDQPGKPSVPYRDRDPVRTVFRVAADGTAQRVQPDWAAYERMIRQNNKGGRA